MAVPKVAVIALVAIVAVPILLGYALNLTEVSVTDYKKDGESVNVTPLIQNGVEYNYANANIYSLNTNFKQGYAPQSKILPDYQETSGTASALPMTYTSYSSGTYPTGWMSLGTYNYYYFQSNYDDNAADGFLSFQIRDSDNSISHSVTRIHTVYWDYKTSTVEVTYYATGHEKVLITLQWDSLDPTHEFRISEPVGLPGPYIADGFTEYSVAGTSSSFANLAAGFRLNGIVFDTYIGVLNNNEILLDLPQYPNNVLLTMDLSTITDSDYELTFNIETYGVFDKNYTLKKTTDSSGEHWVFCTGNTSSIPIAVPTPVKDMYYDLNRTSNTYQIFIDNSGIELRYVGDWPTLIGFANYYWIYKYEYDFTRNGGIEDISFWHNTPVMRVDSSEYRAFELPIIEDQTYTPGDFRTNPSTILNDVAKYGNSITFGGNTYTVTNGNITLGTHQVSVRGIVLDSVPNSTGTGYDNRINGTIISTTADPSQIVFNGQWSASVSTTAQITTTHTKTEWVAGSFAWNGIDDNFLLAGLITSLGVFIALGIYGRRSGARVLPLMLVCGGAALLFFIMI